MADGFARRSGSRPSRISRLKRTEMADEGARLGEAPSRSRVGPTASIRVDPRDLRAGE